MEAGKSSKEVFGCIGAVLAAVLAALIAGVFSLIAADKIHLPFSGSATAATASNVALQATLTPTVRSTVPNAEIVKLWEEENVSVDGKMGLKIHVKFQVNNLEGVLCQAVAYFYDESGQALKDDNNEYATPAGLVASQVDFTPGFPQTTFEDLVIAIPYDELHIHAGESQPKYFVSLIAVGNVASTRSMPELDRSAMRAFTFRRGVTVSNVTQEHNAQINGQTGMNIHIKLETTNLKNVDLQAIAYFYFDDGTALKDYNQLYATSDGYVSAYAEFTPIYDVASFNDLVIAIPYDELHLTVGEHALKFHVEFSEVQPFTYLSRTDAYSFTVTQD